MPGTATPAFMLPEQRFKIQTERVVRAHVKAIEASGPHREALERKAVASKEHLHATRMERRRETAEAAQVLETRMWNAMVRRERSATLKEQELLAETDRAVEKELAARKLIAKGMRKRCQSAVENREVHEARLAQCGETQKAKEELHKSKSAAIFQKHQLAEVHAKESKEIRRWEAKKQAMERILRTELSWAKIDEVALAEEQKCRTLEQERAERTAYLRKLDVKKDLRQRMVQQREKDARTEMHKFYPLIAKASKTCDCAHLHKSLAKFTQRPCSAPSLRQTSAMRSQSEPSLLKAMSSVAS